ncbi:alanine:cation symporter family protein, partial [Escherichia coli]|nr:alanine:cation symporter family protein [Escherichia coli]
QANSIANAMSNAFGWNDLYVGIAVVALSAVVIFGGIKRIAKVAELIVPIMALLYLVLALFVVFSNLEKLPDVLMLIFKSAFGLQEAAAGGLG